MLCRGTPPLEDGIYFIIARLLTVTNDDATNIDMCCVGDMQLLAAGVRALPSVTVIGQVSKGSFEHHQSHSFDIDITQYAMTPQQVARLRCLYAGGLRRLQKTTVPDAGKHVTVHGVLTEIEGKRRVVRVHDITLGPSDGILDARRKHDNAPPKKLANSNWSGEGKRGKQAIAMDSDEDSQEPRKKSKQAISVESDEDLHVLGKKGKQCHEDSHDIGEDISCERRLLEIIKNISQLADEFDFLLPPHILADPFAGLERAFLSPRIRTVVQTSSKKRTKRLQMPQNKLQIISPY
ncbi:hypothetical protein M405DRAFT_870156 [Rhizopogon salebrosus TDB-379]|nr:hypothetical protein M405DRAFT_870156 [Rhizopogon salebrosus TDB-379]